MTLLCLSKMWLGKQEFIKNSVVFDDLSWNLSFYGNSTTSGAQGFVKSVQRYSFSEQARVTIDNQFTVCINKWNWVNLRWRPRLSLPRLDVKMTKQCTAAFAPRCPRCVQVALQKHLARLFAHVKGFVSSLLALARCQYQTIQLW